MRTLIPAVCCILLCLFVTRFSSDAQTRVNPPAENIIQPPGGGGGGGGNDDPPPNPNTHNAIPFSCSNQGTDCNLLKSSSFVIGCDPYNNDQTYYPFVNCIDYWASSHGTPQINQNLPLVAPGVNHASMWVMSSYDAATNMQYSKSEGIAVNIKPLTTGKTYEFSILKRVKPFFGSPLLGVDEFNVVLLTCSQFNSIRKYGEDYTIPVLPANAQQILNANASNSTSWETVTQTFVAQGAYDMLWIYPKNTKYIEGTVSYAWLEVVMPQLRDVAECPVACTVPVVSPKGPIDYYTIVDNQPIGVTLTSNILLGNQWYYNGNAITGATGPSLIVGGTSAYPNTGSGTYYVKNGTCQSNSVIVTFRSYGYGNYGEQLYNLGSKSYPVNTPGYFCANTINNPIKQFNLGNTAIYSWNITPHYNGTPNVTITSGSSSINSYQAKLNVGNPTGGSTPNYIGNGIQAVADLNGAQKIIDFQYTIYPENWSLSTCANSITNWNLSYFTGNITKPGGSSFDWEDYDFGPNSTIIYPTNPSLFITPHKLHIPGGTQLSDYIKVKFSAPSQVTKYFYDNNNFGGCYKENATVSITPGCFTGENSPVYNTAIFPNPATNQISITTKNVSIQSVEIYDLMGTPVKQVNVNNNKSISLNISIFRPGIYNCKITTSTGVEYQKLMVQR